MAAAQESNFDRHITIFSPQGHLYQIEYCVKAANAGGNTAVAVKGQYSAAFITQKKVQDKLIDPSSVTSIYRIIDGIGCLMLGNLPDIKSQIDRLRYEANDFKFQYGFDIPVHVLANKIADINQVKTQQASSRALACNIILIGVDDERGPQVYKIDPAGQFLSYKSVAIGKSEADAMNFLEKRVADLPTLDENGTVELAISTMQYVLSTDFKGEEIEVAVVSNNGKLRVLTYDEIEARLNAISERHDS